MANQKALTDEQVQRELRKMIAFIKQEALEKAKEIHIKADEDFQIEKATLVNKEVRAIDSALDERRKTLRVQKHVATSRDINRGRIDRLHAQQEGINELFHAARDKITDISSIHDLYANFVKNSILQGLYSIADRNIKLRVRETDIDIVNAQIPLATQEYRQRMKSDVKIIIDPLHTLPNNSSGGVVITALDGKISIDNTIEERLRLLQENALPEIKAALFGQNPNRKFLD